jgi:glycine/D-amino acid oxidase-like deaminating enzyme
LKCAVSTIIPGTEPSWWLQEALASEGNPEPAPPLSESIDVDVAIVGGGYTGLWTALALRELEPSLDIAILEADICGSGASGKNGGLVHGYWSALPRLANTFGDVASLEIARLGSRAQDALRAFCIAPGTDVWWREKGILKISCSPAQDAAIDRLLATTTRLGVAAQALPLTPAEVQRRCASPVYRAGALLTEAANVQPAHVRQRLRSACASTSRLWCSTCAPGHPGPS